MAKLFYKYASMNSGKTSNLLQTSFNYEEREMRVLRLKPKIDNRETVSGIMSSRTGISSPCMLVSAVDDLFLLVDMANRHIDNHPISCVLVDEIQFLSEEQIFDLSEIVDILGIPVICYGLKNDFQGNLFPASARLLALADTIEEIKTICWCGKKANHVLRMQNGKIIKHGPQILVGGNDLYISVCRKHFYDCGIFEK